MLFQNITGNKAWKLLHNLIGYGFSWNFESKIAESQLEIVLYLWVKLILHSPKMNWKLNSYNFGLSIEYGSTAATTIDFF